MSFIQTKLVNLFSKALVLTDLPYLSFKTENMQSIAYVSNKIKTMETSCIPKKVVDTNYLSMAYEMKLGWWCKILKFCFGFLCHNLQKTE